MNFSCAVAECKDYEKENVKGALERTFSLLGGLDKFVDKGDKVLIKPNLIAPKPASIPAQTNGTMIVETARILKEFGAKPFVGDSPAWSNISNCLKKLVIYDELERMDVPVKAFVRPYKKRLKNPSCKIGFSTAAKEADKIINLPKLKAHQQLGATVAVKNMFGTVTGKQKAYLHFSMGGNRARFAKMLINIYEEMRPALNIVDAVDAMEGPGPIRGNPRRLGLIVSSEQPICCELICAKVINLDINKLCILNAARELHYGPKRPEEIEILGDGFEDRICRNFVLPEIKPIKFSFGHVCRSVFRQIMLLIKAGRNSDN